MTDYDVVVIGVGAAGLRAAGVALSVVLTPGAAPGDADGPRATITGLAAALDLPPR